MPTVDEFIGNNSPKPPLGATLAEGVKFLSADQTIQFYLYSKYVFALDGMVYWLKGSTAHIPSTTVYRVPIGGSSYQAVDGNLNAQLISGGTITNPLLAIDQGLQTVEPLYVDITGPADHKVSSTTVALAPGQSFEFPPFPENGIWVNAASTGHQFTCVINGANESSSLPLSVGVKGSLHYASAVNQNEEAVLDVNELIFTSLSEVQLFNEISPNQIYIATYRNIKFAFSGRNPYYQQADLWHYTGKALFSTHKTQVIDSLSDITPDLAITDSLPLWLNMNGYVPPYDGFRCPVRLYPSFLVDDNLTPPFCSVHVYETESLVAMPTFDSTMSQGQLCRDKVRLIAYGVNNDMIQTLLAFILQYSMDYDLIGMANMPVISDEKETQPELRILAKKKSIEFEVNYFQVDVRNIARQLIKNVICYVYVAEPPDLIPVGTS